MLRRNIRLACGTAGLVLTGSLLGGTATAWADAVPGAGPTAGSTAPAMPTSAPASSMSAMPSTTASASATAAPVRPRWCAGVTALERRVGREIRRLEAGTSTRGSMAWSRYHWRLDVDGHHTTRARALERRLAWRRHLLGLLLRVRSELRWVANWCGGTMPTAVPTAATTSPGMSGGPGASAWRGGTASPMPGSNGMNGSMRSGLRSGMNGAGNSGGYGGSGNGMPGSSTAGGDSMSNGSMGSGPMSGGGAMAPTDPSMMSGRTGSHS